MLTHTTDIREFPTERGAITLHRNVSGCNVTVPALRRDDIP